jgi:hypothetical protein
MLQKLVTWFIENLTASFERDIGHSDNDTGDKRNDKDAKLAA